MTREDNKIRVELGERIRKWRRSEDITQKDLSKLLSLSQSSVTKWEKGATSPNAIALTKMKRMGFIL